MHAEDYGVAQLRMATKKIQTLDRQPDIYSRSLQLRGYSFAWKSASFGCTCEWFDAPTASDAIRPMKQRPSAAAVWILAAFPLNKCAILHL
jgi:hypothetical protein